MNNKFNAFTMAEVLVTLGVIGVVAAITFPSFNSSWQKSVFSNQIKKVYVETNQAFERIMEDNKAVNLQEAGFVGSDGADNILSEYFNISSKGDFFAEKYYTINKSKSAGSPASGAAKSTESSTMSCAGLANGAAMCFKINSAGDIERQKVVGQIYVDTNGIKGPNIFGRDAFVMYIYPDGTLDRAGIADLTSCKENNVKENLFQKDDGFAKINPDSKDNKVSACNDAITLRNAGKSKCLSETWTSDCFGLLINDNWKMKY